MAQSSTNELKGNLTSILILLFFSPSPHPIYQQVFSCSFYTRYSLCRIQSRFRNYPLLSFSEAAIFIQASVVSCWGYRNHLFIHLWAVSPLFDAFSTTERGINPVNQIMLLTCLSLSWLPLTLRSSRSYISRALPCVHATSDQGTAPALPHWLLHPWGLLTLGLSLLPLLGLRMELHPHHLRGPSASSLR